MEGRFKELILIRLGEVTLKGRNREKFERILAKNIEDALRASGFSGRIVREHGRFFVYSRREAVQVLRRVFGVWSLSPAIEVEYSSLDDLLQKSEEYFRDAVKGKLFAVRARRVGVHGFTSRDIERELGSRLLQYASGVDLDNPEITAYVEVRGRRAYLYTDIVPAYGGLPLSLIHI